MRKSETKDVPLDLLKVDPRVQRPENHRRVLRIAAELNLDALGLVCVSHRDDGDYYLIDGQHRIAALRVAGPPARPVACEVFTGLNMAEEAAMFRLRNNTAKVGYLDRFLVRVVEGDPRATDVEQTLKRHGWTINPNNQNGSFTAVAAYEKIHRLDAVAAERAIAAITRAWGHDRNGADFRIVEGIGLVYARYGDAVNTDDLTNRLAKFPGGASALLGKARGLHNLRGGVVPQAVADLVVELYNTRRKTKGLTPWLAT